MSANKVRADLAGSRHPSTSLDEAAAASSTSRNGGPLLALSPEDYPDVSQLITEDGKPVESIYVEKQYRLLTNPLESAWTPPGEERSFVTLTNVGLFFAARNPPLVPDFLLSLGVEYPPDVRKKEGHSYFVWLFGKAPDVLGEIVSDRRGGEETHKLRAYARQGIRYYWIYDPGDLLGRGKLRVFEFTLKGYVLVPNNWLEQIGLGLTLWHGRYSGVKTEWLRWQDKRGRLLPTSNELADRVKRRAKREKQRADQEKQRADQEKQRADQEKQRADQEKQRAKEVTDKLKRAEAALRAAGLEPPA